MKNKAINIYWFRRDLRLDDNASLYYILKQCDEVVPLFIFDTNILELLEDKKDARVTFIYDQILLLKAQLRKLNTDIIIKIGKPNEVWTELINDYKINSVYCNSDYEPYALERDNEIKNLLNKNQIDFKQFKDHVIFEKDEILNETKKPYHVFTPYKNKWIKSLNPFIIKSYPTDGYFKNLKIFTSSQNFSLKDLGFERTSIEIPENTFDKKLENYHLLRNFPYENATSRLGIHLRFGTLSIRKAVQFAIKTNEVWLSELIWRDFYFSILYQYPYVANSSFKKEYNAIEWRNNESEFLAWTNGKTGYPIVDAGMRQLNATGYMHNRVRMIVASFLCKHLLIDWKWGERYFAEKLLDYELASNVGGWQWVAGTGVDAAPYFRIFNPTEQVKKFDKDLKYIKKWVPEYDDPFKYPSPIVEHKFARQRFLNAYKKALNLNN